MEYSEVCCSVGIPAWRGNLHGRGKTIPSYSPRGNCSCGSVDGNNPAKHLVLASGASHVKEMACKCA